MTTTPHRRRRRWRRRAGWPLIAIGVLLFAYGYLGATTGLVSLPFDRHHVGSQLVGPVLAVVGLRWALSESP
jgi:hypothetical protein